MALTAVVTPYSYPSGQEFGQKTEISRGTFVVGLAGQPYETGGIPVSWKVFPIQSPALPFQVLVWSATGSGYVYVYNTSTQKLQIFVLGVVSGAPLSEYTATTVPPAVTTDTIQYEAKFSKADFFSV